MTENKTKCAHCGANNGKKPVLWNNLAFCCNGCKTVFELLNDNKLYKYYKLENQPGIKTNTEGANSKFSFLDKEEVLAKLLDFNEGGIAKITLRIPVIHCASCIWLLEHLNTLDTGVLSSTVNFPKKEVTIVYSSLKTSLRKIAEMLNTIHYTPEIELGKNNKKQSTKTAKKNLYKLGVAGFVFGNVMLYSLPEYFNGSPLEGNLGSFLRILNYILVIPVVFYSANDYFISAFKNLLKKSINIDLPIALGISMLLIVTTYEVFFQVGQGYADSLAGLIFFLLLGKWYQSKTYEALSFERDYKSYFPVAVTKVTNGIEKSILLSEVKKDDILVIRSKELIPADAELIEGQGRIDYSFVTGESEPIRKKKGDFIYAGGRQTEGIIKIKVKKEVEQSRLTKLWNQNSDKKSKSTGIKLLTDNISKYFTLIVISLAFIGLIGWIINGNISFAFYVFTSVLIVACPCALALSVPFSFGNTMRVFGQNGLYLKNTNVVEKFTHIDTIVFDKTGTITLPDENEIHFVGNQLTEKQKSIIYSTAKQSTHPLSIALSNYFQDYQYLPPDNFVEMPGRGIFAKFKDTEIRLGSEVFVNEVQTDENQKSSVVYIAENNNIIGYFSFSNKYRFGLDSLFEKLKGKFNLYLLSGDNNKEKDRLSSYFPASNMQFNCSPSDKKIFIKKLQSQGKKVIMTGDGLNDAGALMQSDAALSVADDVYHFSPAADAILEARQIDKLANFLLFSKKALVIVKWSFLISLLYNIIGISIALSGNLSPIIAAILMPISSISVVAFSTFSVRIAGRKLKKAT